MCPVVDASGKLAGIITSEDVDALKAEPGLELVVNAADVMRPPVAVRAQDDLHTALEVMLANGISRIPVVDDEGRILGFVDEAAIAKAYLRGHTSASRQD